MEDKSIKIVYLNSEKVLFLNNDFLLKGSTR